MERVSPPLLLLTWLSLCVVSQAYALEARDDWVKDWPGQVVLCISQVYWTAEVQVAITDRRKGLRTYWDLLQDQLLNVVALVRGHLTKQQRITLGALVVIDVHARDVVQDMIDKQVQLDSDFNWLAQLRYYWEADDVYVCIVNARVRYAYEYLGNTPRSVPISPSLSVHVQVEVLSALPQLTVL